MSNDRLPKIIFYSELKDGARSCGGQRKRYKDTLKANLKQCSIVPADLETLVMEQSKWRSLCKTSVHQFESDRIRALEAKREQRKTATIRSAACYPCQICGQTRASRIGLYSHSRMHQHWLRSGIRRVDGPVQHGIDVKTLATLKCYFELHFYQRFYIIKTLKNKSKT